MNNGIHPLIELAIHICAESGVRDFVVAPGSRSAPLVVALARHPLMATRVIYDERAAGYVALGLAQQLRQPVGLVCTSGTAAVNFAPAVVEAYYQEIPLLIFTADRPPEWIEQQDNQAIQQTSLYAPHVRGSFVLPMDDGHPDTRWHAARLTAEAVALCRYPRPGPVHINTPLREPLYPPPAHRPDFTIPVRFAQTMATAPVLSEASWATLLPAWQQAPRKLIVAGMHPANTALRAALSTLSADPDVAVFADITANLFPDGAPLAQADMVLGSRDPQVLEALRPDLVVHFGGQVTSKYVKDLLRTHRPDQLWRVQPAGVAADTYQAATHVIPMAPAAFFAKLVAKRSAPAASDYAKTWHAFNKTANHALFRFLDGAPFGEFQAVYHVLHALPPGSRLQLANSMPVRYANFIGALPGHLPAQVNANRGTSGIDGTVSTAVGAALVDNLLTTLIVGDLAFFYDRNGLWHNHLPPNLRIVLLNNHGGGIFDIIEGPNRLDAATRARFFLTPQPLSARRTAEDHGLAYYYAADAAGLAAQLPTFFAAGDQPALLEIDTDMETNRTVFQAFRSLVAGLSTAA
ncbi:MAG: 2-succinyl-5-enolpyruvyl-6-hydroxy-3-cyclohexene-1-carboxylic-acid synthase [Caldilineaceae bacterium]|nr:2-succinyl-5-enolpyruvyl-6-hydroxy-3-cyclohexene-1-carboxylic-acid synthase [Caldilineaceae bacterium]